MTKRYDHLSKEDLIRLLERRDAMQRYGLIWEREGIEQDRARNQDYVVLDLDPALSTAPQDAAGGRNIPVHARLIDAIAKQAASVPADGLLFPTIGNPDSYGDAIREDIMGALGMPGMKDPATGKRPSSSVLVPCHSFRHTFVSAQPLAATNAGTTCRAADGWSGR